LEERVGVRIRALARLKAWSVSGVCLGFIREDVGSQPTKP
jgi:hypothetical protein